ncbi:MAG: hypothetical protein ACTS7I_01505 [Candidatus Hodgkinia cicadicola]
MERADSEFNCRPRCERLVNLTRKEVSIAGTEERTCLRRLEWRRC